MMLPKRYPICLLLLALAAPAAGQTPRSVSTHQAIGPAGMRPSTRRAIALRPEDAPPALPDLSRTPADRRVDTAVEPATFRSPIDVEVLSVEESTDSVLVPRAAPPAAEPTSGESIVAEPSNEPEQADKGDKRRTLAPPSPEKTTANPSAASFADFSWLPDPSLSMSTTVAATAFVSGLMLLMFAVLKKAAPRSARPLPQDVVSVLGRAPLANKQMAQLMRVGGKLVLVSVGADGAKPITEIDDPEEVARLVGLIEQASPNGASAAFQQVFAEVAKQPASPGFLGSEPAPLFSASPAIDRGQLAAAYANTPGGRAHG